MDMLRCWLHPALHGSCFVSLHFLYDILSSLSDTSKQETKVGTGAQVPSAKEGPEFVFVWPGQCPFNLVHAGSLRLMRFGPSKQWGD